MRRAVLRAVLLLVLLASVTAGAAIGDPGADKDRVDARLGEAQGKLEDARARESVLTSELSALVERERSAQAAVDAARAELSRLEGRLAGQRALLGRLDGRIREQTARLAFLQAQLDTSVGRLERRVRHLYMTDSPDLLSFLVGSDSFTDVLDNVDLLRRIGQQDERIVDEVHDARDGMRRARALTRRTRAEAKQAEAAIAADTAAQRSTTGQLDAHRGSLAAAASERRSALASLQTDKAAYLAEVDDLQAQSAALAERIRAQQAAAAAEAARQAAAAQAATPSSAPAVAPPSGGGRLAWPVGGPVTSGFGMRWGRMHEGVDIAVPEGTPVAAAGAGTVITAGWVGGYGYLVVIDHGGGLATAYGHNSSIAVAPGQAVSQGQVIASSGNTGHSTGPHVHFEVRVGGAPVDPLGYL